MTSTLLPSPPQTTYTPSAIQPNLHIHLQSTKHQNPTKMHSSERFGPSNETPRDRSHLFLPTPASYRPKINKATLRPSVSDIYDPTAVYVSNPDYYLELLRLPNHLVRTRSRTPATNPDDFQRCTCLKCDAGRCQRRDNQVQWFWGMCEGCYSRCHGGVRGWGGDCPYELVVDERVGRGEGGTVLSGVTRSSRRVDPPSGWTVVSGTETVMSGSTNPRVEIGSQTETGGTRPVIDAWRGSTNPGRAESVVSAPASVVSIATVGSETPTEMFERAETVVSVRSQLTARNLRNLQGGGRNTTRLATVPERAETVWTDEGTVVPARNGSVASRRTVVPAPAPRPPTVVTRAPTEWTADEFTPQRGGSRPSGSRRA